MKRALLISSAALAITAIAAPIAALDVSVNGRVRFEMTSGDQFAAGVINAAGTAANTLTASSAAGSAIAAASLVSDLDRNFSNNERVDVNVSASTCCLNYGGKVRIQDGGLSSNIHMSGDWGQLDFGNIENARGGAYDTSVIDAGPAYSDSSIHGADSTINDFAFDGASIGGATVRYTGQAMAGLTPKVALGFDAAGDLTWEGSVAYSGDFAGTAVSGAVSTDSGDRMGAVISAAFGDAKVAAFMGSDDDDDSYTGGAVSYAMGALNMSASMSQAEGESAAGTVTEDDLTVGMGYTIAPGLSFGASMKSSDNSVFGKAESIKARLQLSF